MSKKYTQDEILEKLKSKPVTLLETFKTVRQYHLFQCKVCQHAWNTRLDHVLGGHGCPKCGDTLRYTDADVNAKLKQYELVLVGPYTTNQTKTKFQCLKCNTIFIELPLSLFRHHSGCPTCKTTLYKNQKLTGCYLREILPVEVKANFFIKQPIFHKKELIKKFIIIDYCFLLNGQQFFVEYNGQQHYYPVKFWNHTTQTSEEKFRKQQIRDIWLRRYCEEKTIILIEINGLKCQGEKIKPFLESKLNRFV